MTFKVYFNNIFYTKANAELCLLAMQGHIKSVDKIVPQIVMHPRQGHLVKPDEVMRRIEKLFGPDTKKIELFARRAVDGCDACCLDSEISRNLNETEDKNILLNCNRCNGDNFSVFIKYEYPDEEELKELGFKDISNAFTWITISLTCNNCGKKYKRFIDFES